jgi:hypothetical protein
MSAALRLTDDQLSVEINSFESFDDDLTSELTTSERYTINAATSITNMDGDICSDELLLERVKDMILSVDIDIIDGETD